MCSKIIHYSIDDTILVFKQLTEQQPNSIFELDTPYYYELRNRVCADGSEWLQPEMKAFMSCKLNEINEETHPKKDVYINWVYNGIYHVAMFARNVLKKIDKHYKSNEVHK